MRKSNPTPSVLPAPDPGTVRIAGIVLKWLWLDKEENLKRGEELIREAAANGTRIVQHRFPLVNTAAAIHAMVIGQEQIGTEIDCNGVGYCDLTLRS
ncbi:hypothetical protein ACFLSJ_02330 [Verrucomicrobiota bacterium]